MFGKKKKTYGVLPKKKTKAEIDQQYTHYCVQIGHKSRVVSQLQEEIALHVEQLVSLNAEAMALPPEETQPTPAPTPAPIVEEKQPEVGQGAL